MSQVKFLTPAIYRREHHANLTHHLAPKKDWSLSEWIANFLQEDMFFKDLDYEGFYDDAMPGGDSDIAGDLDDGILESLVIVGLAAALVFLVMYRQQRQQAARRAEEQAARREQQQGGQAAPRNAVPQPAGGQGFFPQPGVPEFGQWAVGGVGH